MRTLMHTDAQRPLHYRPAATTLLARAPRVNQHHPPTDTFRLVGGGLDELSPGRVRNRLRKTVVLDHPRDAQILEYDFPVGKEALRIVQPEGFRPVPPTPAYGSPPSRCRPSGRFPASHSTGVPGLW